MIRRSFIEDSPVLSDSFLSVTLSFKVNFMIERRYHIKKACSFLAYCLYIIQASAAYCRMDSTLARYIFPLTRQDTWWLFQSLLRSLPKDILAVVILLCISVFMVLFFRPNFFDALEKVSTILWISSAKWATSARHRK